MEPHRSWIAPAILRALGQIGDARAIPSIRPLLKDWQPEVRLEAAKALGRLGDKESFDAIAEKASAISGGGQVGYLEALHAIDAERARPLIEKALRESLRDDLRNRLENLLK